MCIDTWSIGPKIWNLWTGHLLANWFDLFANMTSLTNKSTRWSIASTYWPTGQSVGQPDFLINGPEQNQIGDGSHYLFLVWVFVLSLHFRRGLASVFSFALCHTKLVLLPDSPSIWTSVLLFLLNMSHCCWSQPHWGKMAACQNLHLCLIFAHVICFPDKRYELWRESENRGHHSSQTES